MATNTSTTSTTHTGNGSTNNFSISFPFLANTEVDVTVAGVLKTLDTHYTISGSTVTFTSGNTPANGAAIKFQRDTNISAKKVDFQDGSVLTETDLDTNSEQVLFAQQEITDKLSGIEEGATGDQTAAEIRTLVESATDSNVFTDADHSKLNAIEANATQDQTISEIKSLIAGSPLDASHLAANSVDSSELVDGSVDTSHLSADCVTNAKIADNSIDSEHYVDGSIDTAHIGNSQVTTAKIADDSITNAKIGAGAVGSTELDTGAIITAKLANDAVTNAKIGAGAVGTTELDTGAVTTAKLAADSVTNAKIGAGAVGTTELDTNAVTTAKIADAELKTLAGMQSGTASKLADSTALTSDIADLNQIDGMAKQTTITDDDTKFPTSGAVVDYVAAQIAPIGGLEVIANEDSFPTTQPASGVVISISDIEGLIVNGSGVATNARTSGNGSDNVTINGFPSSLQSKTMAAGLGLMVSSTGSSQTYTYHKLLAKEADVEQLSNDINDFAARYRVGSSNPTSELDAGDLFFNTSTQKLLVYNGTNSAWEEAQSIGNFFISTLSPAFNGSLQDFTITNAPSNAQQILLSINGVIQKPNSGTSTPSEGFALSGSTVKLAAAPASGSDYFAIVLGSTVNIGTPSDNTVTTAILQNGAVTNDKVSASAAIAGSKIDPNFTSNLKVDSGTNSTITVEADSDGVALVKATGGSGAQATAALELVQSTTSLQGGGISYNGDGSPTWASGETADNVTFYRMLNGNRSEVFSYPYNSDAVTFNGTVVAPAFQGNLNGTVNTASQTNITAIGTLSSLTVSGTASPINLTHTSGHCVSLIRGSKSLNINANYAGQNNYSHIAMTSGMDIRWQLGGADRFSFKSDGHIEPLNNNQLNLGSDTTRFKNIYAKGTVTGVNISGRNLINNGAMQISQRKTSQSIAGTGTTFVLDRWGLERTAAGTAVVTMSQDNQAPEGFSKSLKIDVTTADTSLDAGERWQVRTRIEAQNLKQLKYGTSNAKQMIISFFVRSNVTGTFTVGLYQQDGNKVNSGNYTINSANTWEQNTVIINGNTVNAMTMDASLGIQIGFGIGVGTGFSSGTADGNWSTTNNTQYAGQTNLLASTDNELFITGVQAEVGNVATEFEHKSYGQDLAECQRYYEENNCTWAGFTAAAQGNGSLQVDYKVAKRATPTLSTKTAATSVQNLTSQNLQDATLDRFVVDTRINSSGYGRFYDLLAASDAEL